MALKRFLEIDHRGVAFHEPSHTSPFSTGAAAPPREVLFCDCEGVGTNCHHAYAASHAEVYFGDINECSREDWLADHRDPTCHVRRQMFVDVTNRPEARLGMYYDEATDTFSVQN